MKHLALTLFIFLTYIPFPAHAFESLRFQEADSYKENQILDFIKTQNKTAQDIYHLAPFDLNNDAIDEYIIKPKSAKNCPQAPLCPYQIVAFQERQPILIGSFDAHKILISDKKTYGIRHIIVYNQRHNDFKTAIAVWNPFSFRFELP